MLFNKSLIVAFLAVVGATANPVEKRGGGGGHHGGQYGGGNNICPDGLYSSPQCCSADVAGIAGLDCNVPGRTPRSGEHFQEICAENGSEPKCCVLSLVSHVPAFSFNTGCLTPFSFYRPALQFFAKMPSEPIINRIEMLAA